MLSSCSEHRPDFHRWACFVIVCACQGLAVGAFRALTSIFHWWSDLTSTGARVSSMFLLVRGLRWVVLGH